MGAVFGIVGDANSAELEAVGRRLAHRGGATAHWSPAPAIHLGMSGSPAAVETVRDGVIVFDGAIDNRIELIRLLKRQPEDRLSGTSDALLVLELYSALGDEGFQEIAGQFAFALWDGPCRRLLLARDRIGYAPLYFTTHRGRFVFASEYKALLAIDGITARPNREAIQAIHSTKWVQPGATCLEAVYPVAPGTWLSVERTRIQTARFWNIPIQVIPQDEAGHAARLRSVFLETLRRRIESSQKIGISMTGV